MLASQVDALAVKGQSMHHDPDPSRPSRLIGLSNRRGVVAGNLTSQLGLLADMVSRNPQVAI